MPGKMGRPEISPHSMAQQTPAFVVLVTPDADAIMVHTDPPDDHSRTQCRTRYINVRSPRVIVELQRVSCSLDPVDLERRSKRLVATRHDANPPMIMITKRCIQLHKTMQAQPALAPDKKPAYAGFLAELMRPKEKTCVRRADFQKKPGGSAAQVCVVARSLHLRRSGRVLRALLRKPPRTGSTTDRVTRIMPVPAQSSHSAAGG